MQPFWKMFQQRHLTRQKYLAEQRTGPEVIIFTFFFRINYPFLTVFDTVGMNDLQGSNNYSTETIQINSLLKLDLFTTQCRKNVAVDRFA